MGPLDEYMRIFDTGEQRMRAPTTDRTSEMDLNVEMPEMPGYLEGLVVQAPQYRQAVAVATPATQTVYGTQTRQATASVARGTPGKTRVASRAPMAPAPLFAINTNVPAAKVAESSSSSTSTSPSAGAPPPSPPDALPPPPDAAVLPDAPSLVINRPGTLTTDSPVTAPAAGSSVGGLVFVAAVLGGLWWYFGRRDEDDRRGGVKGLSGAHEVHDLELYMDNIQSVYNQRRPFQTNAARRMRKGTYDPSKAPKLWLYYVERGIAAYNKEHGRGSMKLTRDEKMTLAKRYAREWEGEMRNPSVDTDWDEARADASRA